MRRAILLLGLLTACGGSADAPTGSGLKRDRSERIAASREQLREQVERIESADLHTEVLAAIEQLFADNPEFASEREVRLDSGSAVYRDLKHYSDWNRPKAPGGPIAALDFESEKHPYEAIVEYARELEEHGIDFLVVPVPTRLQVDPERLPGVEPRENFAGGCPGTARLLLALAEADVEVVDLLSVFGAARDAGAGPLYHDLDSHWTTLGVSLAADAITARLRQMDWFEPGPYAAGADFEVRRERGPYPVVSRFAAEPIEMDLERVVKTDGEPAHEVDRESPILLVGDSFTRQYMPVGGGLASLLFARTGWRVDAIRQSGGGANMVWQSVRRRGDSLAGKRVVIWVFTARALGYPNFELAPLFVE